MPRYEIGIRTPKMKQTFVTEDLEDDQVRKTRLKSFIDAVLPLSDFIIDIRPFNKSEAKPVLNTLQAKEVECLHETGRICPLGEDQSVEACLHCDGRGMIK